MAKGLPKNFERLLVQWRVELGMTQAELAQELRVSQVTVSKWEAGKATASRAKEFEVLQWAYERGLIDRSPKMDWKEEG